MGSNWTNNVTIHRNDHHVFEILIDLRPVITVQLIIPDFSLSFKRSMDRVVPTLHGLNLNHVVNDIEDVRALIEFLHTGSVTVSNERLGHLGRLAECLQVEGLSRAIGQLIASTVVSTAAMHPERSELHLPAQDVVQNTNWNAAERSAVGLGLKSTPPFSLRIANLQKVEQTAATATTMMANTEPAVGYTLLTPVVHRPSVQAIGHFPPLKTKDALQHAASIAGLNDPQEPTLPSVESSTLMTPMTLRIAHLHQDAFMKTLSGYVLDDYRRNNMQPNLTRNSLAFESTRDPPVVVTTDDSVPERTEIDEDPRSGTESEDASTESSHGRQHHGAWRKAKRGTETPEQRRIRLENEARYRRERRVLGTTEEVRKRQLERNAARMRAKRAAETPEQRRIRRENEARYRRELRATETEEKRQRRLQRDSARQRANRAARSRRRKAGAADSGSASTEASSSNPSDSFCNVKVNMEHVPTANPISKEAVQVTIKNEPQLYGGNDYWQLTAASDADVHHERVSLPSSEFVDQFVRFLDSTTHTGGRVEFRPE